MPSKKYSVQVRLDEMQEKWIKDVAQENSRSLSGEISHLIKLAMIKEAKEEPERQLRLGLTK